MTGQIVAKARNACERADELVVAAWREFKALRDTSGTASALAGWVERFFPALTAKAAGSDLVVKNTLDEQLFVVRLPRVGHGGFSSLNGSDSFHVSESDVLLRNGGGVSRSFQELCKQLATFNNRFRAADHGSDTRTHA